MRIPFITLIGGGALALGGCAYGDLGLGMGYGDSYYGGYGYGSPYYGAGYGGYYSGYGYGSPYYGGFGYGSPFGWYDNYYYPGSGIYVYDNYRRPRIWNDRQRSYWSKRLRTSGTSIAKTSPNWSGFSTRSTVSNTPTSSRQQRMVVRQQRQQARQENRRQHDQRPQ